MYPIKLAGKFAGLFSSGTFLVISSLVLFRAMSLDYDTVIYALKIGITGSIVAGLFGYFIGKTFESARKRKKRSKKGKKESDLLIDDLLVKDLDRLPNNVE